MRKQRSLIASVIIIGFALLDFHSVWERSKAPSPKAVREPSKASSSHAGKKTPEINHKEQAINECEKNFLAKMARGCDYKCLADAVRPEDPDLATYIEYETSSQLFGSKKNIVPKSKMGRFNMAVYRGTKQENLAVLFQLSQEDRSNAFPAFFLAEALYENDRSKEAITVIKEALKRPHYKNYVSDYQKRLKSLTIHDERLYAVTLEFIERELDSPSPWIFRSLNYSPEDIKLAVARKIAAAAIKDQGKGVNLNWITHDFENAAQWIEEIDPESTYILDRIRETSFDEEEEFPQYASFECDERNFQDRWKREEERLKELE